MLAVRPRVHWKQRVASELDRAERASAVIIEKKHGILWVLHIAHLCSTCLVECVELQMVHVQAAAVI